MKRITPQEAQILEADKEILYLDVRTVSEYVAGHAKSALNVAVLISNPVTGQMTPNPDFLPAVESNFPKEAKIIVGCMSGGRSQFAATLLEHAGYQNAFDMQGGFGGKRDPMGRVVVPGWRDSGLPIESGDGGSSGYHQLLKQVKNDR